MNPKDIENPIVEEDFRHQLKAEKEVIKISSNLVLSDSVCLHLMTYVDDDNFWKCCQCNEIVD